MGAHDALGAASERVITTHEAVEGRVAGQSGGTSEIQALKSEIRRLAEERERLQADLDEAKEHAERLEIANQEVANQLDSLIDSIKSILGGAS